jgi:hypothetical protein
MTIDDEHAAIGNELIRWSAYGVLFSLLPLELHCILLYLHAPRAPNVWRAVVSTLSDGGLLLIGCCIGTTALGERIGKSSAWPRLEATCAYLCLGCIAFRHRFVRLILVDAVGEGGQVFPRTRFCFSVVPC